MNELDLIMIKFQEAKCSEDVFGPLTGERAEMLTQATKIYRRLAKVAHPDLYAVDQKSQAEFAFKRLNELWETAQKKIDLGTYGSPEITPLVIKSRRHEFTLGQLFAQGDISDLYFCDFFNGKTERGIFKVSRERQDNQYITKEAKALGELEKSVVGKFYTGYFPKLVDSFSFKDGTNLRSANIFNYVDGLFTLEEVKQVYPDGVDPKDAAWIWRRLLFTLGNAHNAGWIHGAVLPKHVLVHPDYHGLMLVGWGSAVKGSGESITSICAGDERWYPPEVFTKQPVTFGLDIYMAAKCLVFVLGGNQQTLDIPETVPQPIRAFFRGTAIAGVNSRPQNALSLINEFDQTIVALWGKRTFHRFSMPPKNR